MKRNRIIYGISGVSLLVLLGIFNWLSPDIATPLLILMVFGLIYIIFFGLSLGAYQIVSRVIGYIYKGGAAKHSVQHPKVYAYVAIASLAAIALLAMSSIGRVAWYEVLLISLMTGLAGFYIHKR